MLGMCDSQLSNSSTGLRSIFISAWFVAATCGCVPQGGFKSFSSGSSASYRLAPPGLGSARAGEFSPMGGLSESARGDDTYTVTDSYYGGTLRTYTCADGYSIVSGSEITTSGALECVPGISGATITYGACSGDYFLVAVCAKTTTSVLNAIDTTTLQRRALANKVVSTTSILIPSGQFSCIPAISGNDVSTGGCGVPSGETGYSLTAISAPVADTKVITDSHAGYDGVNFRTVTCPSGYRVFSATEITGSGGMRCIPTIVGDKVYYGACSPSSAHGNYNLTAVCGLVAGTPSHARPVLGTVSASVFGSPSSPVPTPAPAPAALGCQPVRKYTYTLASDQSLSCTPGNSYLNVFDVSVPDTGRVLARATLNVVGYGDSSLGVHGWTAQTKIGDPDFSHAINFGVGEDVCPGESLSKRLLAYGNLTSTSSRIQISAAAYRSQACQNGTVRIAAGSTLEVWVEDSATHCMGKDIAATSYFRTIWGLYGSGANVPTYLTTNLTALATTSLTTTAPSTLRIMAQSEVSPSSTSNACGNRYQTAGAFISLNGTYVADETAGYAPSEGMSHVLLSPEYVISTSSGTHTATVSSAVNQTVQVGAQAGATFSGDSIIAIVIER
ncbi:MAG: hypothetical protein AB7G93_10165 [Bdellovibrionales bacterium]